MSITTPQMIADVKANGGGSYQLSSDSFHNGYGYLWNKFERTSGYIVAQANGIEGLPSRLINTGMVDTLAQIWEVSLKLGYILGFWQDENGLYSVDKCEIYHHREEAIEMGMLNDQKAIWDIANEKEIVL